MLSIFRLRIGGHWFASSIAYDRQTGAIQE